MNKTAVLIVFSYVILAVSCRTHDKVIFSPDHHYWEEQRTTAEQNEIILTQNTDMPEWLDLYLAGGIFEIERAYRYQGQYVFVGSNRGNNFNALQKWAEGFTVEQDFPQLAALRIENRMILGASLYPDDEYGGYFEALIKEAFNTQYPGAVKEETYWIRTKTANSGNGENITSAEQYEFFVFLSIEKELLRDTINFLLLNVYSRTELTRNQKAAITYIQQNFFEGF